MTCREFVDFLSDYLSDDLSRTQRATFERHLAACDDCRHYLDSFRGTLLLAKRACQMPDDRVPAEAPEDLVKAILAVRRSIAT